MNKLPVDLKSINLPLHSNDYSKIKWWISTYKLQPYEIPTDIWNEYKNMAQSIDTDYITEFIASKELKLLLYDNGYDLSYDNPTHYIVNSWLYVNYKLYVHVRKKEYTTFQWEVQNMRSESDPFVRNINKQYSEYECPDDALDAGLIECLKILKQWKEEYIRIKYK